MSPHARYSALYKILCPLRPLWGFSVLKAWGPMRAAIDSSWLNALQNLSLRQQYQFLQGEAINGLPNSLQATQSGLYELGQIESTSPGKRIPAPWDEGLTPKKNHEIAAILAFLGSQQIRCRHILDIGGGAGHLARHLACELQTPTYTIDRQAEFQNQGRKILGRRPWKQTVQQPFQFIHGLFPQCLTRPELGDLLRAPVLSVGLHTCGPLAWSHLNVVTHQSSLLNFGCCYDKLQQETDLERSQYAQKLPLQWTTEALFLATRGGKERSFDEFEFQYRVQCYRFALHFLLQEMGLTDTFVSVGQTAPLHYRGTFSDYAHNRCRHLQLNCSWSDTAIQSFYEHCQEHLDELWIATILRNLLARPLELLLMLDRVLWLEEQGHPAQLLQFFDPRISPRNLGIYVVGDEMKKTSLV